MSSTTFGDEPEQTSVLTLSYIVIKLLSKWKFSY